jgi:hypothetical protein
MNSGIVSAGSRLFCAVCTIVTHHESLPAPRAAIPELAPIVIQNSCTFVICGWVTVGLPCVCVTTSKQLFDQRCSVRFPLQLKVAVRTESREEHAAETQNISSGGVLMDLETELKPETPIEFTIVMPADVLGSPSDVQVNCIGRVVRSAANGNRHTVAAVIDEYQFKRP